MRSIRVSWRYVLLAFAGIVAACALFYGGYRLSDVRSVQRIIHKNQSTSIHPPASFHSQSRDVTSTSSNHIGNGGNNSTDVQQIAAPYVKQLTQLRQYYLGKVDALVASAIADHQRNHTSTQALISKYSPAFNQIAGDANAQVNALLSSLQQQLQEKGLPTTEVDVLRNEYNREVNQEVITLSKQAKEVQ